MESTTITSEITEVKEEQYLGYLSKSPQLASSEARKDETSCKKHVHPIEDEHTQLIETHGPRKPSKVSYSSHSKSMDLLHKSALKKPVRVDTYQAPGLGISESVTLKQALRKLCISQASEMAAMKRLSKPIGVSVTSEAGTIKRLYAAVVVQSSESGNKEHEKLLEISLLPKKNSTKSSKMVTKSTLHTGESCNGGSKFSLQDPHAAAAEVVKPKIRDVLSSSREGGRKLQVRVVPTRKEKTKSELSSVPTSKSSIISSKSDVSPRLVKPISKNKDCSNKKMNHETTSAFGSCNGSNCQDKVGPASNGKKPGSKKGSPSSASSTTNLNVVTCLEKEEALEKKPGSTLTNSLGGEMATKRREISRSREKGECSQSSKSSCGDYSSSTSISDESNQSGSSVGIRPHMSNDVRWAVIRHVEMQDGSIGLKNFKLLKRLGCGDIGTVYLAELIGLKCSFALKVMDNEFLISRKKITRARTEREILEMLDHPFLPTLYTHFTTDNLSCLVMEYCPGGDLHVLRQKQLGRSFSEPAARFYVAEVLLALEYLHMLGVVYRDLKPENILVREDGHIMLSDFDLSLRCTVSPRLSTMGRVETVGRVSGVCGGSYCIDPLCLQPSCAQVSCFTPRLTSSTMSKTRKLKSDLSTHVKPLPQLVVEPVEARSNSFVGTHEYLAPEIIKGEGHGSSVDWWTFGIFLYELLFGRTPFKGSNNDETLANVVSQSLKFPDNSAVGFHARDLIKGLLVKEPENRLGSLRGAAEIKGHPFFTGLNWALIRCAVPPEVPLPYDFSIPAADPPPTKKKESKGLELRSDGDDVVFELF